MDEIIEAAYIQVVDEFAELDILDWVQIESLIRNTVKVVQQPVIEYVVRSQKLRSDFDAQRHIRTNLRTFASRLRF